MIVDVVDVYAVVVISAYGDTAACMYAYCCYYPCY